MTAESSVQIHEVAYHRNGVSGQPFYVVRFSGNTIQNGVAVVFREPGQVAVLDADMTARGNIAFGQGNSWRGDEFEADLRAAIGQANYGEPQAALEERAVVEAVRQQLHDEAGREPTVWELAVGMVQMLCGASVDGRFGPETRAKAKAHARSVQERAT